ncbi:MAG: hypothetical protein PHN64_03005 [Desulfovibrionaceae bacterium]|nr:hypothetical protein [Desulfovibrionaceae bacterium]
MNRTRYSAFYFLTVVEVFAMVLTRGAIGNLINRYAAVLKKCRLMNTFGSLAIATMLVAGGAGLAVADVPVGVNGGAGAAATGTVSTGRNGGDANSTNQTSGGIGGVGINAGETGTVVNGNAGIAGTDGTNSNTSATDGTNGASPAVKPTAASDTKTGQANTKYVLGSITLDSVVTRLTPK